LFRNIVLFCLTFTVLFARSFISRSRTKHDSTALTIAGSYAQSHCSCRNDSVKPTKSMH